MHNHLTPKFSVITVTYNAEAVLEDTIQSVISQTYRHVEYIIVDGASKDKTLSITDRYKNHIAQVVSEPDKGLYDAMNKGIRLATGDYLCFLNAGDSFHEDDTLQQMVHTLTGSELPDVLYGETALVDKEGHFVRMRRLSAPETLTWKSFKQGMLVCHQAFFEVPFLRRLRLVYPYHEESADATQYSSHDNRLSGRGYDYPEQGSLAQGALPHHGATLRLDKHRSLSCLVRTEGGTEKIICTV